MLRYSYQRGDATGTTPELFNEKPKERLWVLVARLAAPLLALTPLSRLSAKDEIAEKATRDEGKAARDQKPHI